MIDRPHGVACSVRVDRLWGQEARNATLAAFKSCGFTMSLPANPSVPWEAVTFQRRAPEGGLAS